MSKRVSTAEAKAHLSALVALVAEGKEQVIIEKRGKPVAKLVSVKEPWETSAEEGAPHKEKGILSLLGLWSDVPDDVIDKLVADIYAERERDKGRTVNLEP